jgi:hypothetical protein
MSSEGEGGKIPTKTCYTENTFSNQDIQWKLKCPAENDTSGIGDCPAGNEWFRPGYTDRYHNTSSK